VKVANQAEIDLEDPDQETEETAAIEVAVGAEEATAVAAETLDAIALTQEGAEAQTQENKNRILGAKTILISCYHT